MKLSEFQREMESLNRWAQHGCGNHGCVISPPKGQGTNSTCQCTPYRFSETLLAMAAEVAPQTKYKGFDKEETK
jgi:hypothetical protein